MPPVAAGGLELQLTASRKALLGLAALGLLSLGLLSWVDDPLWRWLPDGARWIAEVRLPSLSVCFALCLVIASSALRLPRRDTRWRPLLAASAAWLLVSAVILLCGGGIHVALPRTADLVAYLGTGLLAEELLFRGALQELAERAFPGRRLGPFPFAIFIQAVFFSASHAQYQGFSFGAALPQIALTLPMGILFGWVFSLSGSLWPVVLLHFANNALPLALGHPR